jgi:hypothetical protein
MIGLVLSALAMGIAGAAHCAAMCGGVAALLCGPKNTATNVFAYNIGRVASYVLFGAMAGAIGSSADAMPLPNVRAALRLLAAAAVIVVGLRMVGFAWATSLIDSIGSPLFRALRPIAARFLPARSARHALALGAIWGWLPCGLVYAAVTLALSSGSAIGGALVMLAFGAATLPAMTALGTIASRVRSLLDRPWPRRIAGAALVVSGTMSAIGAVTQAPPDRPAQCALCVG